MRRHGLICLLQDGLEFGFILDADREVTLDLCHVRNNPSECMGRRRIERVAYLMASLVRVLHPLDGDVSYHWPRGIGRHGREGPLIPESCPRVNEHLTLALLCRKSSPPRPVLFLNRGGHHLLGRLLGEGRGRPSSLRLALDLDRYVFEESVLIYTHSLRLRADYGLP